MTKLITFASPHLRLGDRTLGAGKGVALLAYLSTLPGRATSRLEAFSLLYAHNTPRNADAFRQVLVSLRRVLPDVFTASGDTIRLVRAIASDRQDFLSAFARGEHESVVALYEQEFFQGFSADGAGAFLVWAGEERTRLRQKFEVAAETLMRQHLDRIDWTAALALALDITERFAHLDLGVRLLIESMTLAGRGDELRSALDEFPRRRDTDAAMPASDRERRLDAIASIAREHQLAMRTRPLVGRGADARTALDAWSAARSAGGGALLIDAPRGHGKSRFLANMMLRFRLETEAVFLCRAARADNARASTLLHDIARSIVRLPGSLGASPASYQTLTLLAADVRASVDALGNVERAHIVEALVDCLRAVSEEAPLAMLIDDFDCADAALQHVMLHLVARLHSARFLMVVTSRSSLDSHFETIRRRQITLTTLSRAEIRMLLLANDAVANVGTIDRAMLQTNGVPSDVIAYLQTIERRVPTPPPTTRGSAELSAGDAPARRWRDFLARIRLWRLVALRDLERLARSWSRSR